MKAPNAIRIGGGVVGAEEGSFETDGVDYKVRHVFGGSLLEPKAAPATASSPPGAFSAPPPVAGWGAGWVPGWSPSWLGRQHRPANG
jgi:hypothetical protein